jgi:hypothetical protein
MYPPNLGRFLQPDPIGYGDGLNLYNYVGSDPVNSADSTGERGLTKGETSMLRNVFGGLVSEPLGGLYPFPFLTSSITFPWEIDFKVRDYSADFSREPDQRRVTAFYHEFYHLLEIQNGIVSWAALAANIITNAHSSSIYDYDPNKSFMSQNPEARAQYFSQCISQTGLCAGLDGFRVSNGNTKITVENSVLTVSVTLTGSRIPHVTTMKLGGVGKIEEAPASPAKKACPLRKILLVKEPPCFSVQSQHSCFLP